ncbi:MAG: TlpA disulfide reductase family protein [Burkholderiales bacterium]
MKVLQKKFFIPAVIGGLIVAAILVFMAQTPYATKPAPAVRFQTLTGESFDLASLRGKVVLVNFWATSCEPCVRELPGIAQAWRRFGPQGFEVVAVAMSYDPPNRVVEFSEKMKLPMKVSLDLKGEIEKQFGGLKFVPTSFVIDRRGNIVRRIDGEIQFGALHSLIEAKQKEPN